MLHPSGISLQLPALIRTGIAQHQSSGVFNTHAMGPTLSNVAINDTGFKNSGCANPHIMAQRRLMLLYYCTSQVPGYTLTLCNKTIRVSVKNASRQPAQ